ncbi:hypothetical protein SPFL3102_02785 [Sporomusaceae bacterium FL31]|nr:hypothetical protein SPFL3101_01115 [Sporomusaceae bacterium FL31]GCE34957.1 hypothetical protein SPFL3102_02785 [Sporomusaceae bacterium]
MMTLGKLAKKYILMAIGCLSLALGILGIFLPLLPTVPFLLLTAYCFARSSDRLYHWLIHHKTFGSHIYHYQTYRAIKRKTKVIAISVLWGSMGLSMILLSNLYIGFFLFFLGIGVTFYILSLQTLK